MASMFPKLLSRTSSDTDAASQTTASLTPTSGRRLYLAVGSRRTAGTPSAPTVSGTNGFSGTWTQVATAQVGDHRLTLFRSTAQSGTAGTVTPDWGAETQLTIGHFLIEVPNCNEAPVQSKTATVTTATALNFDGDPLAAFSGNFNGTLCAVVATAAFSSILPNATQALMNIISPGASTTGEGLSILMLFCAGSVTSPAVTFSSGNGLGIAVELAHDGSDISSGVPFIGGQGPHVRS